MPSSLLVLIGGEDHPDRAEPADFFRELLAPYVAALPWIGRQWVSAEIQAEAAIQAVDDLVKAIDGEIAGIEKRQDRIEPASDS